MLLLLQANNKTHKTSGSNSIKLNWKIVSIFVVAYARASVRLLHAISAKWSKDRTSEDKVTWVSMLQKNYINNDNNHKWLWRPRPHYLEQSTQRSLSIENEGFYL